MYSYYEEKIKQVHSPSTSWAFQYSSFRSSCAPFVSVHFGFASFISIHFSIALRCEWTRVPCLFPRAPHTPRKPWFVSVFLFCFLPAERCAKVNCETSVSGSCILFVVQDRTERRGPIVAKIRAFFPSIRSTDIIHARRNRQVQGKKARAPKYGEKHTIRLFQCGAASTGTHGRQRRGRCSCL